MAREIICKANSQISAVTLHVLALSDLFNQCAWLNKTNWTLSPRTASMSGTYGAQKTRVLPSTYQELIYHTSDSNILNDASKAKSELWRRDQEVWAERFNVESQERVKAQKFQAAQIEKQITAQEKMIGEQNKIAEKQAQSADSAKKAAWASAIATIALVLLTAILVAPSVIRLFKMD